jgi:tetratricopeptide (TPR) repeat protein
MRYWLDLLPRDIVMDDPKLRYLLLWSLAVSVAFNQSADELALIDGNHPDPSFQARVHTVRMQSSYALGDVEGIHVHGLAARELIGDEMGEMLIPRMFSHIFDATSCYMVGEFEEADANFAEYRRLAGFGSQPRMLNPAEGRYADALCLQGRLDDAEIVLNQLLSSDAIGIHPTDVQAFWFMASIHLERNELDLADSNLDRALQVVDALGSEHCAPPVYITRGMVDWARGNSEAAHANTETARRLAKDLGNPNYVQRADALQAMMWIAKGQHILAERWLATASLNLTWVREFNQPYPALAAVRLLAAREELDGALERLDGIIDATRARRRTGDLVRLHAMKAGLLARCDTKFG